MRELRHDFRAVYGVAYDDVPTDEAVDLVLTLPRGSMWRASRRPYGEWSDADERAADVVDALSRFMTLYATGSTEGARLATRPRDMEEAAMERERARRAKEAIESTVWEEA